MGNGFGNQGLACSRCTEEENATRRFDPKVLKSIRHRQWPFDALLESFLDIIQATDISPRDFRNLNINLAQCARFDVSNRKPEVIHLDFHLLKDFRWNLILIQIDFRQITSKCLHRRFSGQTHQVCTHEPV